MRRRHRPGKEGSAEWRAPGYVIVPRTDQPWSSPTSGLLSKGYKKFLIVKVLLVESNVI